MIHLLGKKWTIQTLILINNNKKICFNKLKKELKPITSARLSTILKTIINQGLVKKRVFHNSSISVEYYLTRKGKQIIKELTPLLQYE